MKDRIYLDYNASAPLHPEALDAINIALSTPFAAHNASAVHHFGRKGRKIIETARENIANLIGTNVNQILLNSGATEGNNLSLIHI